MCNSESEKESRKKGKGRAKDSGDERKEWRDREKEERKEQRDREKEQRDREKEQRDWEKEERKRMRDREKEERKEQMDREKEERKERMDREKEERDREKEERKRMRDEEKEERKRNKHETKHSHPSTSGVNVFTSPVDDDKAASRYNTSGVPSQPAHPFKLEDVPWYLHNSNSEPTHDQRPPQFEPVFPVAQSPPPQYSPYPPLQPPQAVGDVGGLLPVQNVPPSGYRIPLSPNAPFPAPAQLGQPPATDLDGSTPIFIGSAIFPDSVHPCRIIPSIPSPCRVLRDGSEVEHHGRYDLLPITQNMEWVPTKGGEIPPGRCPVEGGYESNGSKLYHALGSVKGVYVPGKAGQHLVSGFCSRWGRVI